jgi:UDP-GlcNAc:undecaprenyl-phosphate GlcNAc-1-phosphate transferase
VTLLGLGVVGGAIGWLLVAAQTIAWPVALGFLVALMLLGIHLARVPAYDGEDFNALQKASFAPLLGDLTFRWHAAEVLLDVILITLCYYSSYRIRFEGESLGIFGPSFGLSLPVVLGCKLAALYASGIYSRMWSTFGLRDLATVVRGVVGGSVLSVLAVAYAYRFERFSRGVFIIDAALLTLAIIATRSSFRLMSLTFAARNPASRRVLIYGAGANGQMIAREMLQNPAMGMKPVAFIDDDPAKAGRHVHGLRVHGGDAPLDGLLEKLAVDELLLSSRAINGTREAHAVGVCNARSVAVRRLWFEIR